MDVPNSHPPFEILLVEDNPADVEITMEAFRHFDDCLKLVEDIQQYWLQISKLPPKNNTVP